ncbi:MAG: putative transcriptional regulator [Frankiales bacterium]|nr:putative transcriptional regulator [Frankiales bacterium]
MVTGGAVFGQDAGVSTRPAGRPRDPALDERALTAARAVYAERGWSGFTMDGVAKQSGIGKGSLYLRWPNKAELLIEAVRSRTQFIAEIDTGALRSDLIEFARGWLAYMNSDDGALAQRLTVDARFSPELRDALAGTPYPEHIRATRAMIRRGITRGELRPDVSVTVIADLIAGAMLNHARTTPPHLRARATASTGRYIMQLVDTVLTGLTGSGDSTTPGG